MEFRRFVNHLVGCRAFEGSVNATSPGGKSIDRPAGTSAGQLVKETPPREKQDHRTGYQPLEKRSPVRRESFLSRREMLSSLFLRTVLPEIVGRSQLNFSVRCVACGSTQCVSFQFFFFFIDAVLSRLMRLRRVFVG